MKLEQQVTNLELSKKLKELGVKQESYFEWVLRLGTWQIWDRTMHFDYETGIEKEWIPAYSVAELGEMLPKRFNFSYAKEEVTASLCIEWKPLGWTVSYLGGRFKPIVADTEANARGKMLCWLIENKHSEVKNVD